MKLKEAIEILSVNVQEVYNLITKDCSHFLTESKNLPLYKGISVTREFFFKSIIAKNIPTGLQDNKGFVKGFDNAAKYFGFIKMSDSTFCTGSKVTANLHGTIYRIFMIDDFKYLWSRAFSDSLIHYVDYVEKNRDDYDLIHRLPRETYEEELKSGYDFFKDHVNTYSSENLDRAIKSKHEIMITNSSGFYAIKINSALYRNICKKFKKI